MVDRRLRRALPFRAIEGSWARCAKDAREGGLPDRRESASPAARVRLAEGRAAAFDRRLADGSRCDQDEGLDAGDGSCAGRAVVGLRATCVGLVWVSVGVGHKFGAGGS